jgi:hypothetical protein
MAKRKSSDPLLGRWQIVSMTEWDDDYLNEEVEAYIEFSVDRLGSFQFGYVRGSIDHRITERDGKPAAEFSWEGGDGADGTPLTGRGWAVLEGDKLSGMIFIHLGDESGFVARHAEKSSGRRRR